MKRKIAKNPKGFRNIVRFHYWKNREFGIELLRSESPKFRFMFYLSRYDETHCENLLTWWNFLDIL